ncbi:hypothetical protein QQS21_005483 [Conoideocrella luteorostrata]|uniref:RCC1-like domain-containing protein n=1 Tax=Conoideocrella luteorostrata TaxID=1105319 RepID=A0AAJ0G0X1_9HYPO|nr:hypothetical protein QQS21_005483 [Conoideocrella luteorostrata]
MPSTKASSTRKTQPRAKRTKPLANNDASRVTKSVRTKSTGRLQKATTLARHKRVLENRDDRPSTIRPTTPPPPTEPRPGVINQVPTEKLAVLVFGTGEAGELGLGPKKAAVFSPTLNPLLTNIVQLACGGMHTVALTSDNKIVTWGVNDESALGRDTEWDGTMLSIDKDSDDDDEDSDNSKESDDGEEADMNPLEATPMEIPSDCFPRDTQFSQVAAGDSCSFALTTTGQVYGWGTFRNSKGETGFRFDERGDTVEKQASPLHIQGLQNITQICCGDNHALALDIEGNIWAWGRNEQYQFGRRLIGRGSKPALIPQKLRVSRNKVKYIACGGYHCFAIDQKDNVYGWGANSFGEAGYARSAGSNMAFARPTKIRSLCQRQVLILDGGAHHSAAVTADGDCLVWGRIDDGQLGIDFAREHLQNSTQDSMHIRYDDRNRPRICLRPAVIPTVQQVAHVACSSDHTIVLDQAGNAYSSGFNSQGQLGHGSDKDVVVMKRIEGLTAENGPLTWAGAGGQFSMVARPTKKY